MLPSTSKEQVKIELIVQYVLCMWHGSTLNSSQKGWEFTGKIAFSLNFQLLHILWESYRCISRLGIIVRVSDRKQKRYEMSSSALWMNWNKWRLKFRGSAQAQLGAVPGPCGMQRPGLLAVWSGVPPHIAHENLSGSRLKTKMKNIQQFYLNFSTDMQNMQEKHIWQFLSDIWNRVIAV